MYYIILVLFPILKTKSVCTILTLKMMLTYLFNLQQMLIFNHYCQNPII